MMLEMIILTSEAEKCIWWCLSSLFRADDHDNFDGDNYDDGMTYVHEEYEADQYTSIAKRSTKNGANGRNPEDL